MAVYGAIPKPTPENGERTYCSDWDKCISQRNYAFKQKSNQRTSSNINSAKKAEQKETLTHQVQVTWACDETKFKQKAADTLELKLKFDQFVAKINQMVTDIAAQQGASRKQILFCVECKKLEYLHDKLQSCRNQQHGIVSLDHETAGVTPYECSIWYTRGQDNIKIYGIGKHINSNNQQYLVLFHDMKSKKIDLHSISK